MNYRRSGWCSSLLVFKLFRFVIIDIDKIAHDVLDSTKLQELGSSSAYPHVVKAFGRGILKEPTNSTSVASNFKCLPQIDRQKLGDIIFRDKEKRSLLNSLTHPRIIRIMLRRILYYHLVLYPSRVVVVDIPLLFEAGWWMPYLFGYIIVVATTKSSVQLRRLMKRNPELTKEQCQQRIDSQYPVRTKVNKSDAVVWNDTDIIHLESSLDIIKEEILNTYRTWSRPNLGGVVLWMWLQATMLLGIEYSSRYSTL